MLVSFSVSWFRQAFGDNAHQRALDALPAQEKSLFSRYLLSAGWYPVASWLDYLSSQKAVAGSLGVPPDEFERRALREACGGLVQKVFQTVLTRSSPQTMISRLPMFYNFFFDNGRLEVRENSPGVTHLTVHTTSDMNEYARRYLFPGIVYFFDLAGTSLQQNAVRQLAENHFSLEYLYQA